MLDTSNANQMMDGQAVLMAMSTTTQLGLVLFLPKSILCCETCRVNFDVNI